MRVYKEGRVAGLILGYHRKLNKYVVEFAAGHSTEFPERQDDRFGLYSFDQIAGISAFTIRSSISLYKQRSYVNDSCTVCGKKTPVSYGLRNKIPSWNQHHRCILGCNDHIICKQCWSKKRYSGNKQVIGIVMKCCKHIAFNTDGTQLDWLQRTVEAHYNSMKRSTNHIGDMCWLTFEIAIPAWLMLLVLELHGGWPYVCCCEQIKYVW